MRIGFECPSHKFLDAFRFGYRAAFDQLGVEVTRPSPDNDLNFYIHGNYSTRVPGGRDAVLFTDDPYEIDTTVGLANGKWRGARLYSIDQCTKKLVAYSKTLPPAAIPGLSPAWEGEPKTIDVLVIGTNISWRQEWIETLVHVGARYKWKICLVGPGWHRSDTLQPYYRQPWVTFAELPNLFRQAKIFVNVHRDDLYALGDTTGKYNRKKITATHGNPLAYMAAGLGVFQVIGGWRSTLLEHFPRLPMAKTPGSLVDHVGTWLEKSEADRLEVARATADEATTTHTYVQRAEQILKETML